MQLFSKDHHHCLSNSLHYFILFFLYSVPRMKVREKIENERKAFTQFFFSFAFICKCWGPRRVFVMTFAPWNAEKISSMKLSDKNKCSGANCSSQFSMWPKSFCSDLLLIFSPIYFETFQVFASQLLKPDTPFSLENKNKRKMWQRCISSWFSHKNFSSIFPTTKFFSGLCWIFFFCCWTLYGFSDCWEFACLAFSVMTFSCYFYL